MRGIDCKYKCVATCHGGKLEPEDEEAECKDLDAAAKTAETQKCTADVAMKLPAKECTAATVGARETARNS